MKFGHDLPTTATTPQVPYRTLADCARSSVFHLNCHPVPAVPASWNALPCRPYQNPANPLELSSDASPLVKLLHFATSLNSPLPAELICAPIALYL